MPAISSRFNRFLLILMLQGPLIQGAQGQLPRLSEQELEWLGSKIFQNECASSYSCLTSWNEGEDFPSLGIGHFIWYQADQMERFEETFPALLAYFKEQQVNLPAWLNSGAMTESPWRSREQFYAEIDSGRTQQLRQLLADTMALQVQFISQRLYATVPEIVQHFPNDQWRGVEANFDQLANSDPPYGLYALIDYVHFKGSGLNPGERYQNQGWGLLQVLQQMQDAPITLDAFISAADTVLERRVANAPLERNEQRWLAGWKNRLQTYRPMN